MDYERRNFTLAQCTFPSPGESPASATAIIMFRANGSMLGVNLVMNMLVLMISLIVLFVFVQVPSFLLQYIVERPRNQRLRRREKQLESLWIDIHTERDVLPEDLLLHEGQTHMLSGPPQAHEANIMPEEQNL